MSNNACSEDRRINDTCRCIKASFAPTGIFPLYMRVSQTTGYDKRSET
ncbi:Protein of unknown function [Pyronema omphalodes CBS 100304]|uniref:Uncharacterized protein n=1 Tax=Pyronema omphalodes (strain CBS 100304) TaxID=1076935 RepID=U4LGK4_PYROM|nr:Protein of unknown function [Pyronema omphalodes CBS 100304]